MKHPSLLSTFNNCSDHTHSGPISAEMIAAAIAGVVNSAHAQGESLADLTRLVLEDDQELDWTTRQWLSEIVTETWQELYTPEQYEPRLYASMLDAA